MYKSFLVLFFKKELLFLCFTRLRSARAYFGLHWARDSETAMLST
jgi:hypothetical protein